MLIVDLDLEQTAHKRREILFGVGQHFGDAAANLLSSGHVQLGPKHADVKAAKDELGDLSVLLCQSLQRQEDLPSINK